MASSTLGATMKSVVPSTVLRVAYLAFGGIPALGLAVLCVVFFPGTFRTMGSPDLAIQSDGVFGALILSLAILGTVSGWLAFFAIGTNSAIGRVLHYAAIAGGIFAASYFLFTLPVITSTSVLLAMGPVFVGCCLLFHISRIAQPINPPGLRDEAAQPR
ncbi:MAG: hypothetical protein JNJ60_04055 [Rhodocyclaceae bacterium]|nr:hypothetical protein [Rhodocyclaceae bacterium]